MRIREIHFKADCRKHDDDNQQYGAGNKSIWIGNMRMRKAATERIQIKYLERIMDSDRNSQKEMLMEVQRSYTSYTKEKVWR